MKPITWFVDRQVQQSKWCKETVPADVLGTSRPITIYRAPRRSNLIKFDWHGDKDTFCPPMWYDLAIGSGACGFACRRCFLMLTFRIMRDPWGPLIYDNVEDFEQATRHWLLASERRPQHTLGLGIDCSDSLLYEGVTGHARRLIPLFANPETNPQSVF